MNTVCKARNLGAALAAIGLLSVASLAFAQQAAPVAKAPAAGPVQGLPQADPTAGAPGEEAKQGWLLSTPLVDVPWPQVKMPTLNWKTASAEPTGEQKQGPITRMSQATRSAAQRTRTAWNSTIEKMKIGPFRSKQGGQEPSFFAKWFGGEEEPQRAETVAEFIGQDRPEFR